MADVEPVAEPVPAPRDRPCGEAGGEHEASDVLDQPEPVSLHDVPDDEDVFAEASKTADVPSRGTPPGKDRSAVPVKPASAKVSASTPTHKRASHSATLGVGTAKAGPPGKTTAVSPSSPLSKTASPSTARKSASASSANQTKTTTMASSRGSGSGPAPPSRRSSMVPPRAPSATGAPPPKSRTSTLFGTLTSSASSKPLPAESRPSVVSPVGSVASLKSNATGAAAVPMAAAPPPRPRAGVSEAVKRPPSTSRQSLPPAPAQPLQSRTMRPMGSISSIREFRDDGKALEDLQEKLREANESLSAKSDAVVALEARIQELESSLSETVADASTKASFIQQLQFSKKSSDAEISGLKAGLQQVQTEQSRDLATLNSVSEELKNANAFVASQAKDIQTLEAQIGTLQADIMAAQENFDSLRSSSDQSSAAAAAAAQMEREGFLRAKADIETVTAELNGLRAAHSRALEDIVAKSGEAEQRADEITALTARMGEFRAEREDSAAKISELEIEILELKESQDNAEDEQKRTLERLAKVEAELTEAVAATERALRDAETRDAESKQKAADATLLHADELRLVKSDLAATVSQVEVLRIELAAAHAAHDETKAAAHTSAEVHEQEMEEAEQSYLSKHIELSEEIKRLHAELQDEEAKYSGKVSALEAEHDRLLREAFERAKNEAGEVHGQDLQALRAESHATTEQLLAAHQSTVNDLQAEYKAALESQVGEVEKKLDNQSLELRATQDDLSKAKAALDASHAESDRLRGLLEDAHASLTAASSNANQAAEMERLTRELGNVRDENVMLNDVLAVTKESLSEMSTNHSKELEEAARVRVEELMRLRSIHDGELSTLAAQKSELALSLSDLQGEIAVLQAQLAAVEPIVAPRSNGTVHATSTTVTRDELQKVHEAHNSRMHDLEAEHDRIVRALRVEIDTLQARLDEVQQDVARKSMEIQYLEQEQEENQDSITRYVKVFGLQSLFGVVIALAVIFDFI